MLLPDSWKRHREASRDRGSAVAVEDGDELTVFCVRYHEAVFLVASLSLCDCFAYVHLFPPTRHRADVSLSVLSLMRPLSRRQHEKLSSRPPALSRSWICGFGTRMPRLRLGRRAKVIYRPALQCGLFLVSTTPQSPVMLIVFVLKFEHGLGQCSIQTMQFCKLVVDVG